jgi:DNA-directed RNA polymerase specialized sigma subunit
MENDYCVDCEKKEDCKGPCDPLQAYLLLTEGQPLSGSINLSSDYIDKTFADPRKEKSNIERARELRKERKSRGKAIGKIIGHLAKLTGEEGKSLKYFFIWKMSQEEEKKHWEIAEIMGLSRRRVSQILEEIKLDAY